MHLLPLQGQKPAKRTPTHPETRRPPAAGRTDHNRGGGESFEQDHLLQERGKGLKPAPPCPAAGRLAARPGAHRNRTEAEASAAKLSKKTIYYYRGGKGQTGPPSPPPPAASQHLPTGPEAAHRPSAQTGANFANDHLPIKARKPRNWPPRRTGGRACARSKKPITRTDGLGPKLAPCTDRPRRQRPCRSTSAVLRQATARPRQRSSRKSAIHPHRGANPKKRPPNRPPPPAAPAAITRRCAHPSPSSRPGSTHSARDHEPGCASPMRANR
jgi:hypothetical protein